MDKLKKVEELESAATKGMPLGGLARSLPVARKSDGKLEVVFFWYVRSNPFQQAERVYPPKRIIIVDPLDARVLRNEACTPHDFRSTNQLPLRK